MLGAPVSLPPVASVVEAVPVALAVPAVTAMPPVPVIRPIIATNTYQQVSCLFNCILCNARSTRIFSVEYLKSVLHFFVA